AAERARRGRRAAEHGRRVPAQRLACARESLAAAHGTRHRPWPDAARGGLLRAVRHYHQAGHPGLQRLDGHAGWLPGGERDHDADRAAHLGASLHAGAALLEDIVALGLFAALTTISQGRAYMMTLSSYVEAVKQVEILFAMAVGIVAFGEAQRVRDSALGAVVMLIG